MSVSSRTARPLLAAMFITGGLDAFRHPESKVKAAEAVTKPLSAHLDFIPDDAVALVRINGGVQVVAGSLLALGRFNRLSALVLMGSLIPTTYAGHRFWLELDDEKKAQQRTHFLKNLGLLGGLILAATDTEGAPSASWRIRRQLSRAGAAVHTHQSHLRDQTEPAVHKATDAASHLLSTSADLTNALLSKAEDYIPTH